MLLSTLVLPGLGQFLQRRWLAGVFYLVSTGWAASLLTARLFMCVGRGIRATVMDPEAGNAILGGLCGPGVTVPLFAWIFFYVLNMCDVQYAEMYRRRRLLERNFARRIGLPSAIVVVMTLFNTELFALSLHEAVQRRDVLAVSRLLETDRQQVNAVAGNGVTPLHVAAALDDSAVAGILIAAGADLEAATTEGFTPLHWAASRDAIHTARMLIRLGANIDAASPNGITPLHWAAGKNATNVVKFLIRSGVNVDAPTTLGLLPRHWAVRSGAEDAATLLIFKTVTDSIATEARPPAAQSPAPPEPAPAVVRKEEPAIIAPGPRAVPGETLAVPLGFGQDMKFVWIKTLGIWVGKYEVSNGQYRRFKPGHDSLFRESFSLNEDDQPAVYVSWLDAAAFCQWLNRNFSHRLPEHCLFRLPTSEEWKAVARCGDNRTYPWGRNMPPRYGNYSDITARETFTDWSGIRHYDDGFAVTCPVVDSGSNEWGVFGLAGNVWEWCLDWYDVAHRYRVRHGASWDFDTEVFLPIDSRGFDRPDASYDNLGFRIVVSGPPEKR